MKIEVPNVREITEEDWEFIAEIVDKNPDFCNWLGHTPTVWLKRIENGKHNRIWEKDGQKGLIVIGGINSWDECLKPRTGGKDVQIKLYYYSIPSNEQVELQYLQELGKQLISPLKENGLNAELEIIGVDGNEEKRRNANNNSTSTNGKTELGAGNSKHTGSKTSPTADKSTSKHSKSSNSKRTVNA